MPLASGAPRERVMPVLFRSFGRDTRRRSGCGPSVVFGSFGGAYGRRPSVEGIAIGAEIGHLRLSLCCALLSMPVLLDVRDDVS
jgi:hypothetical protein